MSQADIENVKTVADPTRIKEGVALVGDKADTAGERAGFKGGEDFLTQSLTLGLVGVDEEGGVGGGKLTRQYDEFVGELTGRNARRAELHRQEGLLIQQKAERERLLAEEEQARFLADVGASRAAGDSRTSGGRRSSRPSSGSGAFSLGDQRDFLGL